MNRCLRFSRAFYATKRSSNYQIVATGHNVRISQWISLLLLLIK